MRKIILDLCGGSGAWSWFYRKAGYDVRLVTLPDNDVRTYRPPRKVHGILAAPVCRDFSFALSEKIPRDTKRGMEIVNACLRIKDQCERQGGLAWWALENPIGHLNRFLGEPAFIFQPWEFGDPWTKRTGIWGRFSAPKTLFSDWESVPKNSNLYVRPGRGKPNMIWLHKAAQADIPAYRQFEAATDADFRALTPQGFARAFFKVNH